MEMQQPLIFIVTPQEDWSANTVLNTLSDLSRRGYQVRTVPQPVISRLMREEAPAGGARHTVIRGL